MNQLEYTQPPLPSIVALQTLAYDPGLVDSPGLRVT